MAQGFKAKVAPGKQRSTASTNKNAGKMKKGARIVPPKKKELVEAAAKKRASSSAHGQQFENNVAAKAATKGKLTVMKEQAGKGDAQAKR